MPRYSVVIPTYNRASMVREAVASVLEGGFDDVEVIVVDDGSSDDTVEVLASLEGDERFRWLSTPNMGACVARNVGIALASAEWVGFLDSDDLWEPGFLEAVEDVRAVAGESVVGLYTSARVVDADTGALVTTTVLREVEDAERVLLVDNFVSYGSLIARRSSLEQVGGWDRDLPARQDVDLYLRLARVGRLAPVPGALCRVRVGGADRISADAPARLHGLAVFYRKHRGHMTPMERSLVSARLTARARQARDVPAALRYAPLGLAHVASRRLARARRGRSGT